MARSAVRLAWLGLVALVACPAPRQQEREALLLGATTTLEDSGVLAALLAAFERQHDTLRVRVVIGGTGEVLEIARRGDVDATLTHDPVAESAFVSSGRGLLRGHVMHNDFVLAGPPADPAAIRGAADAASALPRIRAAGAALVSRGDDSGTHRRELALWSASDARAGGWSGYVESGSGMAETLRIAAQRRAYVLADRATFLTVADVAGLEILVEGDPRLLNRYGVMVVAGGSHERAAHRFAEWLTSDSARAVIASFGVERHGRPLYSASPAPVAP